MNDISRRTFLTTTAAGAGLTILPRHVLGRGFQAPSDTVLLAADRRSYVANYSRRQDTLYLVEGLK